MKENNTTHDIGVAAAIISMEVQKLMNWT